MEIEVIVVVVFSKRLPHNVKPHLADQNIDGSQKSMNSELSIIHHTLGRWVIVRDMLLEGSQVSIKDDRLESVSLKPLQFSIGKQAIVVSVEQTKDPGESTLATHC